MVNALYISFFSSGMNNKQQCYYGVPDWSMFNYFNGRTFCTKSRKTDLAARELKGFECGSLKLVKRVDLNFLIEVAV